MIHSAWTLDLNLSYFGDEIIQLARAWGRIQFSLNVIVDQENILWTRQRTAMLEYSSAAKKMRYSFLALLGLFTTLSLAIILSRVLHRRLAILAGGMNKYAAGNWDERLEVPEDGDLAQLSEAFNEMAGQLQRKDEELNHAIEVLIDSQAELTGGVFQLGVAGGSKDTGTVGCQLKIAVDGEGF